MAPEAAAARAAELLGDVPPSPWRWEQVRPDSGGDPKGVALVAADGTWVLYTEAGYGTPQTSDGAAGPHNLEYGRPIEPVAELLAEAPALLALLAEGNPAASSEPVREGGTGRPLAYDELAYALAQAEVAIAELAAERDRVQAVLEETKRGHGGFYRRLEPPSERAYDIALRPERHQDDPDVMDDIVVDNVTTFRAEAIDERTWWLCCYLGDPADTDRVAFWAQVIDGELAVRVAERPEGDYRYQSGPLTADEAGDPRLRPPTSKSLATPAMFTPEQRAAAVAACEALGPVVIDAESVGVDYGFMRGDALGEHAWAVAEALGIAERDERRYDLSHVTLRALVVEHIVAPLAAEGIAVTLRETAHNPARAHTVDGLTNNERVLPWKSVTLSPDQVADALLAALGGYLPPEPPGRPLPSAMTGGLAALVGREVEVQVSGDPDENLRGRLVSVTDSHLTITQSYEDLGRIGVIPLGQVRMVRTDQLTDDEYRLTDAWD
jgi:hypothetical protein